MVLAIYGAGGLGREVLETVNQIQKSRRHWDSVFFVEDRAADDIREKTVNGVPALDFELFISKFSPGECEFTIAVGEPAIREKLFQKVKERGYFLATIVHPSAFVTESATLKEGTVIQMLAGIGPDTVVGENTLIQSFVSVGHDSTIGRNSVCSSYAGIMGNCHIGNRTYIGVHSGVREQIKIGNDTIIGMGSMVQRDIPDNVIAMGNPARPMKRNDDGRVFRQSH